MKVLLIDDQPSITAPARQLIEPYGYDVKIAADGYKGIMDTLEWSPNLIFLDIQMPRLNGYETCELIRKVEANLDQRPRICMLSSNSTSVAAERGILIGADDYLIKPFTPPQILRQINFVKINMGA